MKTSKETRSTYFGKTTLPAVAIGSISLFTIFTISCCDLCSCLHSVLLHHIENMFLYHVLVMKYQYVLFPSCQSHLLCLRSEWNFIRTGWKIMEILASCETRICDIPCNSKRNHYGIVWGVLTLVWTTRWQEYQLCGCRKHKICR